MAECKNALAMMDLQKKAFTVQCLVYGSVPPLLLLRFIRTNTCIPTYIRAHTYIFLSTCISISIYTHMLYTHAA